MPLIVARAVAGSLVSVTRDSAAPPLAKLMLPTKVPPPVRQPVCPAAREVASFCPVRNGDATVPAPASFPLTEAYFVQMVAAWPAGAGSAIVISAAAPQTTSTGRSLRRARQDKPIVYSLPRDRLGR